VSSFPPANPLPMRTAGFWRSVDPIGEKEIRISLPLIGSRRNFRRKFGKADGRRLRAACGPSSTLRQFRPQVRRWRSAPSTCNPIAPNCTPAARHPLKRYNPYARRLHTTAFFAGSGRTAQRTGRPGRRREGRGGKPPPRSRSISASRRSRASATRSLSVSPDVQ